MSDLGKLGGLDGGWGQVGPARASSQLAGFLGKLLLL